jgi:hypothetical protein
MKHERNKNKEAATSMSYVVRKTTIATCLEVAMNEHDMFRKKCLGIEWYKNKEASTSTSCSSMS